MTPPYIDIPKTAFEDKSINDIQDLFLKHLYINLNTICTQRECEEAVNFYVKKYTVKFMPIILSFNINVANYNELSKKYSFY